MVKPSNYVLQSNIFLESCQKKYTNGLDKAIAPFKTVQRVKGILEKLQLKIVKDTTRIDLGRLGIPVYVCQAGKDCNIPAPQTMGKGATPEQSEASALMEMIERFSHANYPSSSCYIRGIYSEINQEKIPFEDLFYIPTKDTQVSLENQELFNSLSFTWVPAYSLAQHREFLVPFEWFADIQGTNGLSAGNTMEETILQGLCEVIERHVSAKINIAKQTVPTIDLYTVQDPVAKELVSKFFRQNIRLICMDFSQDIGIPSIGGVAFDLTTFPKSEIVYCVATATNPEKALIRVLTEIQQMAIDYFRQDYFVGGILPKFKTLSEAEFLFDESDPVPIQSLPDISSHDLLEEIKNCTAALQKIGYEPFIVNITHSVLQVPTVFVLIPGSELYDMSFYNLNADYFLGRQLKYIGQTEAAIKKFQQSMEKYPESKLHCTFEIANSLMYLQRWEEAIEAYKKASFLGPDRVMHMKILNSLRVCFEKLKN